MGQVRWSVQIRIRTQRVTRPCVRDLGLERARELANIMQRDKEAQGPPIDLNRSMSWHQTSYRCDIKRVRGQRMCRRS